MAAHVYPDGSAAGQNKNFKQSVKQLSLHHKILRIMVITKAEKLELLDQINNCLVELENAMKDAGSEKARRILMEDAKLLGNLAVMMGKGSYQELKGGEKE